MAKLKVIEGGQSTKKLPFVCGWCGARFATRWAKPRESKAEARKDLPSLEVHWWNNPECLANKDVNNQTQTKYRGPEDG